MRVSKRLIAALVVATCLAGVPAVAQIYYTINGAPAPYDIALYMASRHLPPGQYWLDDNGNWGVVGNPRALGNIYGPYAAPQPYVGLSQRGMLFRPGEILSGR